MWALKDGIASPVDNVLVFLRQLFNNIAVWYHELFAWDDYLLIYVLDKGLDKRCANLFDSLFQPDIVVEEFSFTRQNSQINREIKIVAIHYLDETIFDLLCDV